MKPKSLKINIGISALTQLINALVPLAIIPYLSRVLGPTEYGLLVWIQTIMSLGLIWVEFGFGWSSACKVSENRSNKQLIKNVFFNTWSIQWILFFAFSLIGIILFYFISSNNQKIFIAGLGILAGSLLTPSWFFQGLERFDVLAVSQFISRLIPIPLMYLMIKTKGDLFLVILLFSFGSILAGIFSIIWIFKHFGLNKTSMPRYSTMKNIFIETAPLFASRAVITTYTTLVPLAVGSIAGLDQLAYFNIADKIKASLQSLVAPIQQVTFPRISLLINNNVPAMIKLLEKATMLSLLITISGGFVVMLTPGTFINLLGGKEYAPAALTLRWLSFVPVATVVSNVIGLQLMIPLQMNKSFMKSIVAGAAVCAFSLYYLVKYNGAIGAAQAVLVSELFISVTMMAIICLEFISKGNKVLNRLALEYVQSIRPLMNRDRLKASPKIKSLCKYLSKSPKV